MFICMYEYKYVCVCKLICTYVYKDGKAQEQSHGQTNVHACASLSFLGPYTPFSVAKMVWYSGGLPHFTQVNTYRCLSFLPLLLYNIY